MNNEINNYNQDIPMTMNLDQYQQELPNHVNISNSPKTSKKQSRIFYLIFSIILFISAIFSVGIGVIKNLDYNKNSSPNIKNELTQKVNDSKEKLLQRKAELEAMGIRYNQYAQASDGDAYELRIIVDVLEDHKGMSAFFGTNKFPDIAEYCNLMQELESLDEPSNTLPIIAGFIIFYLMGAIFLISALMYFLIMIDTAKKN